MSLGVSRRTLLDFSGLIACCGCVFCAGVYNAMFNSKGDATQKLIEEAANQQRVENPIA